MILQISNANSDSAWEVPEPVLRACLQINDLKEREAKLREHAKPVKVHSTEQVEAVLVLDGHEDELSWEELREIL